MKKALTVLRNIILVVFGIIILWVLANQILKKVDEKKISQKGSYVTVKGKQMDVYSTGEGDKTIVLMPGLGTTAPILDFEPLINRLAKDFHVVIAEPFGYGWSDLSDEDRSVQNIVEELRMALKESGESGPYILMPHSVSGIYASWYADKYPDEVSAIAGIDCALPKQVDYFGGENPSVPFIAKAVNPLGLQRIACYISPSMFISDNQSGEYSDDNLSQQKLISCKVGYNKTMIDEMNMVEKNTEETFDIKFDSELPLLFFTRETKNAEDNKTREDFYKQYITNTDRQKVIVLDTGHYMHWTKAEEIAEETKDFFYK